MFDWLKKHFEKENPATTPKTKPVILTIHGYGRRRKHEFDNLALWGKKDGYDYGCDHQIGNFFMDQ